jgi:lysophospholipase L1-like esterase
MRRFVVQVLVFVLPLSFLAITMEIMLRNIPNDYKYKAKYLTEHSKDIEVLILGSSHSYADINPYLIPGKAFNAAHSSQTFEFDLKILKKYEFPNLRMVIIPISYFSYFAKLDGPYLCKYSLYYKLETDGGLKALSELLSFPLIDNVKRIINYYLKRQDENESNELGQRIKRKDSSQSLEVSGIDAALRHTHKDTKYVRQNVLFLEEIIQIARDKNSIVILFTPPAYRTYTENLDADQLKVMYQITENILKKYDNCYYVDFLKDTDFSAEDFWDADHLNAKGADKLTRKLVSFIESVTKRSN